MRFEHRKKRYKLIESVGYKVIFLLPYSQDLNLIEKFLANMKRWIRNQITQFSKFYESITASFYAQTLLYMTIYPPIAHRQHIYALYGQKIYSQ
nr:hypothetical protein [Orientia tsutsugamushi]